MWALASAAQLGCLPARIISTPSGAPILRGFMRMRTLIPVRRAHCPRVPHTSMTAHRASAWRWFHCEVSREQECRWNIYAAQRISSFVARIRCAEKIRRAARDPAPEPASPGAAQQPKPVVVAAPLVVSSSIWLLMASPRRQHAACAMGCSRAAACRQRRARLARRRPPVRESTRGHVRAELRGVGAAPSLRSGGHLL